MSGIIDSAGSRSGIIGTTELDYEEGTWTPTSTAATSTASGWYTKIGRLVTCHCHIVFNDVTVSPTYGGLPFTSHGSAIEPMGPAMLSNITFAASGRTWAQSVVYTGATAWNIYSSGDANSVTTGHTTAVGQWSRLTLIYITA